MNVPLVRLTSPRMVVAADASLRLRAPTASADQPLAAPYRQLLVGTETPDDAAVWQLDDGTCVIATTDFFMPIVDILTTSAASPRRTRSRTFMRWAASQSWP